MTSIIKADNISTVSGSGNITIPTGVKVVGTDAGSIVAPGHVIQVQTIGQSSAQSNTGSSYADTGLTGSITPKFSNSLILITVSANVSTAGANSQENAVRLYRSAPTTATVQEIQRAFLLYGASGGNHQGTYHAGVTMFDTPGTTSTCTYKWQNKVLSGGGDIRHNDYAVTGVPTNQARMILMEIAQ
jgi:hypothetical protein